MVDNDRLLKYVLVLVVALVTLGVFVSVFAQNQAQQQNGQQQGKQEIQDRMQRGQQIYTQAGCAGCHGTNGEGQSGLGPALSGNSELQDATLMINQILHGGGGMPAFAQQLTDEQIAAVATYERNSWENSFGPIDAQQVAQQRSGQQDQQQGQQQFTEQVASTERTGEPQHHATLTGGQALYSENCAACHGPNGDGATQDGFGPALASNPNLQNAEQLIRLLLTGSGDMPPYDYWFSEEQLAAVASYVRTSWGNSFGEISAEQVSQIKQQIQPQQSEQQRGQEESEQTEGTDQEQREE